MKTPISEISRHLSRVKSVFEECLVEAFTKWAEEDDRYLRANAGFNDVTGNLRSSLGAGVFKGGKLVFSTPFATVLKGAEGSRKGRQALSSMSFSDDVIAKVLVAGMEYAQMVEDIDSKDVLENRRLMNEAQARGIVEEAIRMTEKRL